MDKYDSWLFDQVYNEWEGDDEEEEMYEDEEYDEEDDYYENLDEI